MAISRSGLHQIVACNAGTLATTPADAVAMGIRAAAPFKRSPYKPLQDYLEGSYRNMTNFNIQAETFQSSMFLLQKLISWLNGNVDLQVKSVRQTSGATSHDVYKFNGTRKPGLEFEVEWTSDKRTIKPTFEIALPYSEAVTFVDGADTEEAVTFSGITHPRGEDEALLRRPFFIAFEAPTSTAVLTRDEIASRSYKITTKAKKQEETNISIVDYLMFEIELKFRNASVAKQVEIMNKAQSPSLQIREGNVGAFFDIWDFNAGVLTLSDEFDDTDDDRAITLRFRRNVFIHDIEFQFGSSHGGSVSDDGKEGGRMRVGF